MATNMRADEEYRADMTPMIDVVFLLIVFFLCIEFKVLEGRLDAWLPTDKGSSPTTVTPEEQLVVRVHVDKPGREVPDAEHRADGRPQRVRLVGHRVRHEVSAVPCRSEKELVRELARVAADPALMVPDRENGGRKRMTCVVEGYPGTRYDDIARTADLCRAAGFDDITFGGGMGPR